MNMVVAVTLSLLLSFLLPLPAAAYRRLPPGCPLPMLRISSEFGWRQDPILHRPERHSGIDLAAPLGTPVRSTIFGHVAFVGWRGGYGRVVEVAQGRRTVVIFAHLQRTTVVSGQALAIGQILGRVGRSGRTTGPHLHYEIRIAGIPIDPWPMLRPSTGPARPPDLAIPAAGWRAGPRAVDRSG